MCQSALVVLPCQLVDNKLCLFKGGFVCGKRTWSKSGLRIYLVVWTEKVQSIRTHRLLLLLLTRLRASGWKIKWAWLEWSKGKRETIWPQPKRFKTRNCTIQLRLVLTMTTHLGWLNFKIVQLDRQIGRAQISSGNHSPKRVGRSIIKLSNLVHSKIGHS